MEQMEQVSVPWLPQGSYIFDKVATTGSLLRLGGFKTSAPDKCIEHVIPVLPEAADTIGKRFTDREVVGAVEGTRLVCDDMSENAPDGSLKLWYTDVVLLSTERMVVNAYYYTGDKADDLGILKVGTLTLYFGPCQPNFVYEIQAKVRERLQDPERLRQALANIRWLTEKMPTKGTGPMELNPEMAMALLSFNRRNRRIRDAGVRRLAIDAANGRWGRSHDMICLAIEGVLGNGQHRSLAAILSGAMLPMTVGFGFTMAEILRMDIGANPRTIGGSDDIIQAMQHEEGVAEGVLDIRDFPSGIETQAIASQGIYLETMDSKYNVGATHQGFKQTYAADLVWLKPYLRDEFGKIVPSLKHAMVRTCFVLAHAHFPAEAEVLIHGVTTQAGLEEGTALYTLNKHLLSVATDPKNSNRGLTVARRTLMCMFFHVQGTPLDIKALHNVVPAKGDATSRKNDRAMATHLQAFSFKVEGSNGSAYTLLPGTDWRSFAKRPKE